MMMIYIVSGAPCSGKSTWIKNNAKPGAIVIDTDRIALALTTEGTAHHNYNETIRSLAVTTRSSAINAALKFARVTDIYIIDTYPSSKSRALYSRLGAEWIQIDPGVDVVIQRIKQERPKHLHARLFEVVRKIYG
jgi:predicted kinase